mgnify:CR=1 FL=1
MARKIYQLHEGNRLEEMEETPYLNEARFQELLARYPGVLAGDQIDEVDPRRFVLVAREIGIPAVEGGSGHWFLDHLFLDQDGVPTLVEVKRSTDARLRREVVGQMMDYAANAVVYWSIDVVRRKFEEGCNAVGKQPDDVLTELIAPEGQVDDADGTESGEVDIDHFWEEVETNLQTGRIRLLFVADEIPPGLRRVVEFLNGQMSPAQVLAVELKQYQGGELRTLVPNVIGHTTRSKAKKSSAVPRQWDEPAFFEELQRRHGSEDVAVAREILRWTKKKMPDVWWGRGSRSGGFIPGVSCRDSWHQLIEVWTYGRVEIQFQYMMTRSNVFSTEDTRRELLNRLNQVPGIRIPESKINRRPSIPLSLLRDEMVLAQFLSVLDWAVEKIISVESWGIL